MSAIEAITRTCKTMSDGTLRLSIDISPIHAQEAFKLFGMPDVPMAIARLTQEAAKQSAQADTIEADKPKGGQLSKLSAMWCQDPRFYDFLNTCGVGLNINSPIDAKYAIYEMCDIESRAELDHKPESAEKFHILIREPFSNWLKSHE